MSLSNLTQATQPFSLDPEQLVVKCLGQSPILIFVLLATFKLRLTPDSSHQAFAASFLFPLHEQLFDHAIVHANLPLSTFTLARPLKITLATLSSCLFQLLLSIYRLRLF